MTDIEELPQPDFEGVVNADNLEVDGDNYRGVIERRIGEAKRQRDATVNDEEASADD